MKRERKGAVFAFGKSGSNGGSSGKLLGRRWSVIFARPGRRVGAKFTRHLRMLYYSYKNNC